MKPPKLKPGIEVRLLAAKVLLAVTGEYQQLDDALIRYSGQLSGKDAALLQAICYGVMRRYAELIFWLEHLSKRPANELKPAVQILILSGLFQLKYMRVPAHAAIHATVECAPLLQSKRAKGLINAVLRGFQRYSSDSNQDENRRIMASQTDAQKYSHPPWMLDKLQLDWPEHWRQIVENNNQRGPMVLRVDVRQIELNEYLLKLKSANIEAEKHPIASEALILTHPVEVELLPGFNRGLVSVQDSAAQLAAPLLQHDGSQRVLDACAAPGGKTAHILQIIQPATLVALDNSKSRLTKVEVMLQRIGGNAQIIQGDASDPDEWWDGKLFDRILLDAPCSASGVIRRHPDIKYLRSERALLKIIKRQKKILDAMWQLLKPGGMLLYVTCSVFKAENEEQVSAFMARHSEASLAEMPANWGIGQIGRQILSGDDNMDGFYFALLDKK